MRIRASWRDPYSGVPLMFTSSSPGCSWRDSAALPPSSTWVTEGGVRGARTPRTPQRVCHCHRVPGEKEASERGCLRSGHRGAICGAGLPPAPVT